jgi:predicted extracellular nuclease
VCIEDTEAPTASPIALIENINTTVAPVATPASGFTAVVVKEGCTKIQAIQGNGLASPLAPTVEGVGTNVKICDATVTHVGYFGFFVQDEPDVSSSNSSGIWISFGDDVDDDINGVLCLKGDIASNNMTCLVPIIRPTVGAPVDVNGTVDELGTLTSVTEAFWADSEKSAVDYAYSEIELPVPDQLALERYEGMRVSFKTTQSDDEKTLHINEVDNFP